MSFPSFKNEDYDINIVSNFWDMPKNKQALATHGWQLGVVML